MLNLRSLAGRRVLPMLPLRHHMVTLCMWMSLIELVTILTEHMQLNKRKQVKDRSMFSDAGVYINVTSGSTCERITSKAECEEAATQLGFADNQASEENTSWPPFCYFYDGQSLWFNKNENSTSNCNSHNRICICKAMSRKLEGHRCFDMYYHAL